MALTVNQLAKISNISVRTLHWYDEIGLLRPSFVGSNGYRYYDKAQVLRLQQIMLYKELGFSLKEIQSLLLQNEGDILQTLKSQRISLQKEILKNQTLLKTIESTIIYIEGKNVMINNEELFKGFDLSKQEEYEKFIVKSKGLLGEALLTQSKRNTAAWDSTQWDEVKSKGDRLHLQLANCINQGLCPSSSQVQACIEEHFLMMNRFYEVSYEVYLGLAALYAEHPDFKKFFDEYHKDMIPFLQKAIYIYAELHLKD